MSTSRKLDEIISEIEDAGRTLEEVEVGTVAPTAIPGVRETLERATDSLEVIEQEQEERER